MGPPGTPNWLARGIAALFHHGSLGVYLFFVISGFCIHLRWARQRAAGEVPVLSFASFWKRRFWRLYPPYIVTLLLSIVICAALGKLTMDGFFAYDLGLHLTLLHNLDMRTAYSFNPVFWTLAVEEQLYLAYFALIVLRVRFGWRKTLAICLAARVAWFVGAVAVAKATGLPPVTYEAAAAHWFTWALGALSAEAAVGIIRLPAWCRNGWVALGALLSAALLAHVAIQPDTPKLLARGWWIVSDPMWGIAFLIVINWAVTRDYTWGDRKLPHGLKWLAAAGLISYSLYLTHDLVIYHLSGPISALLGVAQTPFFLLMTTPVCIALAVFFHRLVEKRFIQPPARESWENPPAAQPVAGPCPAQSPAP